MRIFRVLLTMIKPTDAKRIKGAQAAIEDGEIQVTRLGKEYGDSLNDDLKVVILISMLPETLKEKGIRDREGPRGDYARDCEGDGGDDGAEEVGAEEARG